jgi:hypothetical protein
MTEPNACSGSPAFIAWPAVAEVVNKSPIAKNGKAVDWMEKVTDDKYSAPRED